LKKNLVRFPLDLTFITPSSDKYTRGKNAENKKNTLSPSELWPVTHVLRHEQNNPFYTIIQKTSINGFLIIKSIRYKHDQRNHSKRNAFLIHPHFLVEYPLENQTRSNEQKDSFFLIFRIPTHSPINDRFDRGWRCLGYSSHPEKPQNIALLIQRLLKVSMNLLDS